MLWWQAINACVALPQTYIQPRKQEVVVPTPVWCHPIFLASVQLGMIDDKQLTGGQLAPKMCSQFIKTNLWQVSARQAAEEQRSTASAATCPLRPRCPTLPSAPAHRPLPCSFPQRWVLGGQIQGDTSAAGDLPGPSHDPSLGQQQPAPPNSDSVSVDLVPALYMVGAALPRDCDSILLDSAGRNNTNTTADLLPKLIQAMQVGVWDRCL